jgi:hypothetical protein
MSGGGGNDEAEHVRKQLDLEQRRLNRRLYLIETRLGIIYHPRIKLPDTGKGEDK